MSDCYYLVQNDDGKWEKADFYDMDNPIEALTKAYQQGRADVIEEFVIGIKEILEDNAIYNIDCIGTLVEQLKEQK